MGIPKLFLGLTVALGIAAVSLATPAFSAEPANDLVLKGDARCTGCHDESDDAGPNMIDLHPSVLSIGKTKHGTRADGRTPTCTDCHGDSDKHVKHRGSGTPPKTDITFDKKSKTDATSKNEVCLTCHQGSKRIGWQGSKHGLNDVACTSCHQVHAKNDKVMGKFTQIEVCSTCHKEQRTQVTKPSHHPIVEGKMNCASCHNVHSDTPKQLVKDSTNDTCYTCHMEKRGPFVHNHQPVTEDCGICHQPHGTSISGMLKSRAPFLCQECHDGQQTGAHIQQAAALPSGRTTSIGSLGTVARGCLNCHTNIHGGNSTFNSSNSRDFRR
ncbi:DmsE family decaheme c-type cytochrome [uncultured Propionivibrio sp.]|uniref:DmsE family decaheme c-type cytochrome n=1 Tax=uncultured Propionivibrio sp. TaxID=426737 RepID=UPI0029C0E1E8|nr:DmsE family decaheme c-type cytochrome [uncultured Propionivibrio sp.]